MDKKQEKLRKKKAGKCPICGLGLFRDEDELFEKIGLNKEEIEEETVTVTEDSVKQAFKETAKSLHPDRGGCPQEFQEAKEARDELLERLSEGDIEIEDEIPHKPTGKEILQALNTIKKLRQIKKQQKPGTKCPYCHQKPRNK